MKDNFLFIEEGSVDTLNLRKFLDLSGMTDANVIRYKSGTTKPELVSMGYTDDDAAVQQIVADTKKQQTDKIIELLSKFIKASSDAHFYFDELTQSGCCSVVYKGRPETYIKEFRAFIEEDEKNCL